MMRAEDAINLKYGQIIYSTRYKNCDGSPQRWRVTGKPRTFKIDVRKFKVPLKRVDAMYEWYTLEYSDILNERFVLNEAEAKQRLFITQFRIG